MQMYLVTYDRNAGDDYPALYAKIKECGTAWRGMQNVWFVESSMSALGIADHCRTVLDQGDKIFVAKLTESAWWGFRQDGSDWLQVNIAA